MKVKYIILITIVIFIIAGVITIVLVKKNADSVIDSISDEALINMLSNSTTQIPEKVYHPTKLPKDLILKNTNSNSNMNIDEYEFIFTKANSKNKEYLKIKYIYYKGDDIDSYIGSFVNRNSDSSYNTVKVYFSNKGGFETVLFTFNNVIYIIETLDRSVLDDIVLDMTGNANRDYANRKITFEELKEIFIKDTKDAPASILFPEVLPDNLVLFSKPHKIKEMNSIYAYIINIKNAEINILFDYIRDDTHREQKYEEIQKYKKLTSHGIDIYVVEPKSVNEINKAAFIIGDVYYEITMRGGMQLLFDIVDSITKQVKDE